MTDDAKQEWTPTSVRVHIEQALWQFKIGNSVRHIDGQTFLRTSDGQIWEISVAQVTPSEFRETVAKAPKMESWYSALVKIREAYGIKIQ